MADQPVIQSDDTKYARVINSPDDTPDHDGQSLVTTNHEVIKQWAEARNATPATIEGTEHNDHLGVLRFDFPGGDSPDNSKLQGVSWDEWFKTFDDRNLTFLYQETKADGTQSNFFRLENPTRSDA